MLSGPGVYVRYADPNSKLILEDAIGKDRFYVGQTRELLRRYSSYILEEVIYFESIEDEKERLKREAELICEFALLGLPLANRWIPSSCQGDTGEWWVRKTEPNRPNAWGASQFTTLWVRAKKVGPSWEEYDEWLPTDVSRFCLVPTGPTSWYRLRSREQTFASRGGVVLVGVEDVT